MYRIVQSSYEEESGLSYVVIETKYGQFQGYAYRHPEEPTPSNFIGCHIAEMRALLASMKYEYKMERNALKTLKHIYSVLVNCADADEFGIELRKFRKQIYLQETKVEKLKNQINCLTDRIKNYHIERQKLLNARAERQKEFEEKIEKLKKQIKEGQK